MAQNGDLRAKLLAADPDNVPVRTVDRIDSSALVGGQIAVNLLTRRFAATEANGTVHDYVVAARLRFSLGVARELRDHLDRQIARLAERQPAEPPTVTSPRRA